jgi:hypothetical protein
VQKDDCLILNFCVKHGEHLGRLCGACVSAPTLADWESFENQARACKLCRRIHSSGCIDARDADKSSMSHSALANDGGDAQ